MLDALKDARSARRNLQTQNPHCHAKRVVGSTTSSSTTYGFK
jgi:hypothetical protein